MIDYERAPRWVVVVAVIAALPATQMPMLLSSCPDVGGARTLLWIYPFYTLLAAWLAVACYPRRPYMTWILLALMLLTHVAMWMLVARPL